MYRGLSLWRLPTPAGLIGIAEQRKRISANWLSLPHGPTPWLPTRARLPPLINTAQSLSAQDGDKNPSADMAPCSYPYAKVKAKSQHSGFAVPVCGNSAVLHRTRGPNYCHLKTRSSPTLAHARILVYDQVNLTAIQGELSVPIVTLQSDVDFGLVICGPGNVPPG